MKVILELFYIFFKLGLFTFGGGYAMIPQIKEIVVEKKKWISEDATSGICSFWVYSVQLSITIFTLSSP